MNKYIPKMYQKSIYTIDYSKLLNKGIKCILFDLDNTLITKDQKEEPVKAKKLITSLKQKGFKVIIFSNSTPKKVSKYMNYFKIDGISFAFKPALKSFKKILTQTNLKKTEIVIIGDQLLTDIVGGNNFGIITILVNPISNHDLFITKLNRIREKRIINKLTKENLFKKGEYYE